MREVDWKMLSALCLAMGCASCAAEIEEAEEPALERASAAVTDNAVYTLRGVHSGRCLDVTNGSSADGANVQLLSCSGATAQQFRFEALGGGFYQIRNLASGKCLDVAAFSTVNGANIQQWRCSGGENQQFSVVDVASGGVVRILGRQSGKALDALGWGTDSGTNIIQWEVHGGDNQKFVMSSVDRGAGQTAGAGSSSASSGSDDAMGCRTPSQTVVVDETIRVEGGVFDGQCRRYVAGSAVGDGSQSESQDPVFRLEDGSTLRNVILGAPAADGIHTYGDVRLQNITWEDVGEDALTIKGSGTVILDGGSARDAEDKVFQVNAASTFRIANFTASRGGKFIRQNGGTTFRVDVFIDRSDISDMDEAIFRTDSSASTVTVTNTRYSNIGETLFMGVSSGNITTSNNTEY